MSDEASVVGAEPNVVRLGAIAGVPVQQIERQFPPPESKKQNPRLPVGARGFDWMVGVTGIEPVTPAV